MSDSGRSFLKAMEGAKREGVVALLYVSGGAFFEITDMFEEDGAYPGVFLCNTLQGETLVVDQRSVVALVETKRSADRNGRVTVL